ncbi:hypothetical protein BGZ92_011947 [Podila epicladia]|nr:hypothetical protein BGZ92_011947 [Podila epicladia]
MSLEENAAGTGANPAKIIVPDAKAVIKKPVVLIAGAGIGGLTTALLCERAGIEYFVFERASKVKPLGSAMSLSQNVLPALEQLGLLEELQNLALPVKSLDMYKENMKLIGSIDGKPFDDLTGYRTYLFARPDFYELLLSKIPASRIFMGKKISSILQNADGVMIRCVDNNNYHGDILVGADGAYSAVRQSLYKQMDEQGLLPKEDLEELPMAFLSMLGITKPLDTKKYSVLENTSHTTFSTVLAKDKPQCWNTATLKGNRIAWALNHQLTPTESKEMFFRNSEWKPEANKATIDEIYNYPIKEGGIMGDLIDMTDKDLISKVYFEEKLFLTWNYGRTMQPAAGQGAVSAIEDAIVLVNCIYDIEDVTYENIQAALADYRAQRFSHAEFQVNLGKTFAKVMFGQSLSERIMRTIAFNLPKWAQVKSHMKMAPYRPLVSFLPHPPNRATIKMQHQKPSNRYAKEQAARAKKEATAKEEAVNVDANSSVAATVSV